MAPYAHEMSKAGNALAIFNKEVSYFSTFD
jgi:hypothetical protein